ncbi:MAG: twin-arginine translocase subunit TatC [Spirochaetes bacterium]|nr:twin-arginine translocase subunit TatC [Spirochaetota bacterium]
MLFKKDSQEKQDPKEKEDRESGASGDDNDNFPLSMDEEDFKKLKKNIKKNNYGPESFVEELLKEEENRASPYPDTPVCSAAPLPDTVKENAVAEINEDDKKAIDRGDVPMSVVRHLDELRSRLIITLVMVLVITVVSFFAAKDLLDIITRPFFNTGNRLNIFNLTEGFMLNLKTSLLAGVLLGLPLIVFEVWKYIVPAVEKKNRRFIGLSVACGTFLFYAGIVFTYFVMLPVMVHMFLRFTPPEMTVTIGAEKYLSFVIIFSLAVAAMFELPVVILILTRIGIITPEFLIAKRKYAILTIWVVAAVITPPDALTQIMLAIPLMLLYEISIIMSKIVLKRRKKKELEKYV